MSGPLKFKDYVNELRAEDAVYYIQYSSIFQTGKGNPKKNVMLRKRGKDTTVNKKERFSKSVNISIVTQSSSLILQFWGK